MTLKSQKQAFIIVLSPIANRSKFYTLQIKIDPENKAVMDCSDDVKQENNGTEQSSFAM